MSTETSMNPITGWQNMCKVVRFDRKHREMDLKGAGNRRADLC